jgi:hypothetical protein
MPNGGHHGICADDGVPSHIIHDESGVKHKNSGWGSRSCFDYVDDGTARLILEVFES